MKHLLEVQFESVYPLSVQEWGQIKNAIEAAMGKKYLVNKIMVSREDFNTV